MGVVYVIGFGIAILAQGMMGEDKLKNILLRSSLWPAYVVVSAIESEILRSKYQK